VAGVDVSPVVGIRRKQLTVFEQSVVKYAYTNLSNLRNVYPQRLKIGVVQSHHSNIFFPSQINPPQRFLQISELTFVTG